MTKHAKPVAAAPVSTTDLAAIAAPMVAEAVANRMTALDRIAAIGADMGTGDQSRISLALVLAEAAQNDELKASDAEKAYNTWKAARIEAKAKEASRQQVAVEVVREDGQTDKSHAAQVSKFRTFLKAGQTGRQDNSGDPICKPVETLRLAVKVAQSELVRETYKLRTFDVMAKIARVITEMKADLDEAAILRAITPEGKTKDVIQRLKAVIEAAEKIFHGSKDDDGNYLPGKEPFRDDDLAAAIQRLQAAEARAIELRKAKYGA